MLFFKQKVSLSSKFGSLFSVMRDTSSAFFKLELYMLLTKVAHESARLLLSLKFTKFVIAFLKSRASQFSMQKISSQCKNLCFHENI